MLKTGMPRIICGGTYFGVGGGRAHVNRCWRPSEFSCFCWLTALSSHQPKLNTFEYLEQTFTDEDFTIRLNLIKEDLKAMGVMS